MSAIDDRPFPRGALIGAGVIVMFTVAAVGAHQAAKFSNPPPPVPAERAPAALVESRTINARDTADDRVEIVDQTTGAALETLEVGGDGFIRGVLRSQARERRLKGLEADPRGFVISRWADGGLTLDDAATGQRIDLRAFGPTNSAAFERFLPSTDAERPPA